MRISILAAAIALMAAVPGVRAQQTDYPDYQRQSLYVSVRDGTRLAVNIYRPARGDVVERGRLPVIFAFTPYRARFRDEDGAVQEAALGDTLALRSLLRAGYVVAVADIRGKGASFGARRGFQDRTEAQDGHDLVQWLAAQPYTTGEVGMIGCSYLGGTTMHTATTAPPALKGVFIGATDWDKYDFVRRGGITAQFNTRPDEPPEVDLASIPVDADADGNLLRAAAAEHAANTPMAGLWYGMPYRDSISPYTGNAFWDEVAAWRYADAIRDAGIATYFWSNWKDEPTSQVLIAAQNIGGNVLVGPGSHCVPPPGFDFTGEVVRYFDHTLKGVANGFDAQPRATWWSDKGAAGGDYVTGPDVPGTAALPLSFYLAEGHRLAARPGIAGADAMTVDYDVADDSYFAFWPEPLDEHGIAYTSGPLAAPVDLLGYPVAHVALTADKPDAQVFAYLEEVATDGTVSVLSFGRLQLSRRATQAPPWDNLGLPWHSGRQADTAPLAEGEVARLSIAMMPLSRRLEAGSRVRFVVTGADPRQRNLAEMVQTPPPVLTVQRGWEASSRIDLPLLSAADVTGAAQADAPARQIGAAAGRGPYPAIAEARADAPGYTLYRPQTLPDTPMPVVLWGNGGCRDNGLSASHALREFASHGYLVIANGRPRQEQPALDRLPPERTGPAGPTAPRALPADETSAAQLLAGLDWAAKVNADPADPLHGRIDTDSVAATGHSCGGLQALAAGADPRIDTVVAFGSGVYNRAGSGISGVSIDKDDLARLHTPVAYILGGPTDIAYPNGTDDFRRIDHVPVMLMNYPVGHGGTLPFANGGEWARAGAAWLNWQLKGDEAAGRAFIGEDCTFCTAEGWTIDRKL